MKGTLCKKAPSALTALTSFSVKYLPLALMAMAPFSAEAAPTNGTWTGATSDLWSNPLNWSGGVGNVPGGTSNNGDTATFNNTTGSTNPTIYQDYYLNVITFGSSLTGSYGISNASGAQLILQSSGAGDPTITTSSSFSTRVSPPLLLEANLSVVNSGTGTLTIEGAIVDAGNTYGVTKFGTGRAILSGVNSYSGSTTVTAGILQAGSVNAFSPNSNFNVAAGTLDLAGSSNTIKSLTVGASGTVTSSSAAVLTISNGGSVSGVLSGSGLGISLTGGTLTFNLGNGATYQGTTTISNAILVAGAANSLPSNSTVKVEGGGTLKVGGFLGTINQLTGEGIVSIGNSGTLTISSGGVFDGHIINAPGETTGALLVTGSILELTNANTYSGVTTISSGATLKLSGAGQVSSSSSIGATGTLDLSAVSSIANIVTLGSVGGGTVNLGSKTLNITNGNSSYGGNIIGTNGNLTISGGSQTLTGSNSYTGTTTIDNGATLNIFENASIAPVSPFVVNGSLIIYSASPSMNSLSGAGTVSLANASTLTISNGGSFSGTVSGTATLALSGGSFNLTGSGSLSQTVGLTVNGTLNISAATSNVTLAAPLTGSGEVVLGNNTLILNGTGSSFSGAISGVGGVTLGTSTNASMSGSNSYSGVTRLNSSSTLTAASATALSPNSDYILNDASNLSLSGYSNTIKSLSNNPFTTYPVVDISDATLTITNGSNGATFSGGITGSSGALNLTGGTLILGGALNTYTGTTSLSGNAILQAGNNNVFSGNSFVILNDTSVLDLSEYINTIGGLSGDANTVVNFTPGATNTLTISGASASMTYNGSMQGQGGCLFLEDANLTLTNNNTISGTITVAESATLVLSGAGQFSANPDLDLSTSSSYLDISGVTSTVSFGRLTGVSDSAILLGSKTLNLNGGTSSSEFAGNILGGNGNLTISGGDLTLSGTNTYTGTTTVHSSTYVTLTTAAAASSGSFYVVDGSLSIGIGISPSIKSLSGAGQVSLGIGSTLTVAQGGIFSGDVQGVGGLSLTGGTFSLTGGGSLTLTGPLTVNGILDISSLNTNLQLNAALSGSGEIILGNNNLQLYGESATFSGTIDGAGGLDVVGTTVTLAGANTYSGPTNITNTEDLGQLIAGSIRAFSPNSDFIVSGTLDFDNYNNSIKSLSGTGTVHLGSATVTIANGSNGSSFDGPISGIGGINLTGGSLVFGGGEVGLRTYSGTTSLSNVAELRVGVADALSQSSPLILNDSSSLVLPSASYRATVYSLSGDTDSTVFIQQTTLSILNGGNFQGIISGVSNADDTATLLLAGGTFNVFNNNTFPGRITIQDSAAVVLKGSGAFSDNDNEYGGITVDGTLNLADASGPVTLGSLEGDEGGRIQLGGNTLTIVQLLPGEFSGNISGTGGSFVKEGEAYLRLSGTNSYTGTTTIERGSVYASNNQAFAPLSDFTILENGTLDLDEYDNTVNSLSGAGNLYLDRATLTISNGGTFSGTMYDGDHPGCFDLAGGTWVLSGSSNSSGNNVIRSAAMIRTDASAVLSSSAGYQVEGTLDLNNHNNSIGELTGSGLIATGSVGGGQLTINDGGNFHGAITGKGGITLGNTSGSFTLSTSTFANTYSGPTIIGSASTLIAGEAGALSPNSDYTLNDISTLDLNGNDNTIKSLSSNYTTATVYLAGATLTINGGQTTTFAGHLTNTPSGALTIDGGTILTLTGTNNDYSGPTLIKDGQLIIDAIGALSPYTNVTVQSAGTLDVGPQNAAVSITNAGEVIVSPGPLALSDFYTQTIGGGLTLGFTESPDPILTAVNNISVTGSLTVTGSGSPTGSYPIIQTSAGDIPTEFTSFSSSGFDAGTSPFLAYSDDTVYLYFAGCDASWNSVGNTVITRAWGNADNWIGGCVPGVHDRNSNDVANFPDFDGAPSSITVKVANQFGLLPEQLILAQLNFTSVGTSYTITQYSDDSLITFDLSEGGNAAINVTGGNHTLDVPLKLASDTRLNLIEGVSLTLGEHTTLNSDTTQDFLVQALGSVDSGELINDTSLTPYSFTMKSATITNNNTILPVQEMDVNALVGHTATIVNNTAGAAIGPTARSSLLTLRGVGTVVIDNTSEGAMFGPTGVGASMHVGGEGTFTINNTGIGASFGPTGRGSDMIVQGSGVITVANSGVGTLFGPTARGSSLMLFSGTFTNTDGAKIQAGPAATLTVSGATITIDLSSVIGSSDADLTFTSGTITTSGDILAYNYTQNGTSTLQLNITSADQDALILGNVAAEGTAQVGSNLIVNALPGSITSNYDSPIDLVVAQKGVTGTYGNVEYLNFPSTVIPDILYTADAVQLTLADTIPDSPSGSFVEMGFLSVNGANTIIQRDLHDLHYRMMRRNKNGENQQTTASALKQITPDQLLVDASQDTRQQHYLAERVGEKAPNPARFYVGPTGQLGSFNGKGSVQQAFDFNAVGALMGFDYAFETVGLGVNVDYSRVNGKEHHYAGKFEIDEVRGALYGTWVPEQLDALAVDAIVGWGGQWFDVHRTAGHSLASVTAKGNTRGMEADALFGLEYIFGHRQFAAMPPKVLFTPFLNAQYIWEGINGYKENGAGIYNLSVDKQRAQSLRSCLGTRFEYLVEGKNVTFKPELDLAWQREYLDHDRTIGFSTINLPSTKTVSKGIVGAGRNTFLVGVDFLITVYNVFEIEMSYDFEWNNLYKNNSFYLGIGGNF